MATRFLITLAAVLGFGLPAYAAPACVIIYASDMGAAVTREIRNHEYAHVACPWWQHPPRLMSNGKAYLPPAECLPKFKGATARIDYRPMPTAKARAECHKLIGSAHLGCTKCE